ncbi:hypothetical protein QQS21_010302 [Conoideocrella luteorostrata]|uniref:Heat-labile enterotoxin IIA, A chain n=1 Tax=Conoideocrella luteorostrata TaxID=1105319 RepID=A0AAJ0CFF4_9HYPO|nr:hypothetical protein QQS21_010302 [Conoideocrella luteorostrata]
MKLTAVYQAILLGLAVASPAVHSACKRGKYTERPPGAQIGTAIKNGLGHAGVNGDLGPNRIWSLFGPAGEPLKGLSENSASGSKRPSKPASDGSHVLGPHKKPDRIYHWPKEGQKIYTTVSEVPKKTTTGVHGFRVKGQAGKALAFDILSPYAHDLLDCLKKWDNPIGWSVKWFDDAVADLQKNIGGEQVTSIYGNKLKLKLICWLRGDQQYPLPVDEDCKRLEAEKAAEAKLKKEASVDATCAQIRGTAFRQAVSKAAADTFIAQCEKIQQKRQQEKQKQQLLQNLRLRIKQEIDNDVLWQKEMEQVDPSGGCFKEGKGGSQNTTDTQEETCKVLEANIQTRIKDKMIGGLNGLFKVCDESLGLSAENGGQTPEENYVNGTVTDSSLRKEVLGLCESLRDESEKLGLQADLEPEDG